MQFKFSSYRTFLKYILGMFPIFDEFLSVLKKIYLVRTQHFPKKQHFLPPDTHTYVSCSENFAYTLNLVPLNHFLPFFIFRVIIAQKLSKLLCKTTYCLYLNTNAFLYLLFLHFLLVTDITLVFLLLTLNRFDLFS